MIPLLAALSVSAAEVQVKHWHAPNDQAEPSFLIEGMPKPLRGDLGERSSVIVLDGVPDPNAAAPSAMADGRLPRGADQPRGNFFFAPGSSGGRIRLDLGSVNTVREVNTFSWHPGERGPQVYTIYGSTGEGESFRSAPQRPVDPTTVGWRLLGKVDTRPAADDKGGQYGVSITGLGPVRYLLLDVASTDPGSRFAQTFFSEIDVVDATGGTPIAEGLSNLIQVVETPDGKYRFSFNTTEAPDLTEFVKSKVAPMALEWYPQLTRILASEGFSAPTRVTVVFSDPMSGVAGTSGTRVECAAPWFRRNLDGEALGAIFHEFVHVAQQYRRGNQPGWLVEGVADYLRWYRFEPVSTGADIRDLSRARHDASYRVTANFLNYVSTQHQKDLVTKLNAALRANTYTQDFWKEQTGHDLATLSENWLAHLRQKQASR